jgi:hypothetical protein
LRLRDEAVAVLDQRAAHEVELRRLGYVLAAQLGVRTGLAFVRVVGARLVMEIALALASCFFSLSPQRT